jgi:2-phospho-L-lactate/phosphoenolpyruvate guanylyltransferase
VLLASIPTAVETPRSADSAVAGETLTGVDIQVLIPLKALATSKQRLSPAVSAPSRRRLMLHMLCRAAEAARTSGVGPVALATSDPKASDLAATLGVDVVSDGALAWNEGLLHALRSIQPPPAAVLYLSGDLPLVTAADIIDFVAAAPSPGVAIARARDGGTNALLVRPALVLVPMFGQQPSAIAHARQAAERGIAARILDVPGLALDVDTVDDLRAVRVARGRAR